MRRDADHRGVEDTELGVVRKARGSSDLLWIAFVGAATALLTTFLLQHVGTRYELYELARERASENYEYRQLFLQNQHLELERRYRARGVAFSAAERAEIGVEDLKPRQAVELARVR